MKNSCESVLNQVEDLKYIGNYIRSTKIDLNIRISKAWSALNSMNKI